MGVSPDFVSINDNVIPGRCASIEPKMRNCASGNLEISYCWIPGSSLRDAPE
jgi:hypothetical protein